MSPRRFRLDIRQVSKSLLIVYLVLIIVNGAFYLLMTRPKGMEYLSLTQRNAPQMQALRQRTAGVEGREAYLAALDKAESDLEHWRKEILSTKRRRMIKVQLELAKLARQFSINHDMVNYDPPERLEDEGVERFGMVVPLEGGYQNLRSFIQAVENSDKFLVVERVALIQGREGGVLLQLNITLATYFDAPRGRESQPATQDGPGTT